MKRKVLFLVGICAIGLGMWEANASLPEQIRINYVKEKNDMPNGAEEIVLRGQLNYNVGPNAIEAGATDDAVYIQFNQNFGNVSILLYNPSECLIYSTIVNTAVQQMVIIPITSFATGIYTVVLTNSEGYAEGDFEHD